MAEQLRVPVAVGLLHDHRRQDHVWVFRRSATAEWQLPGKKFSEGESAINALRMSLEVNLGINARSLEAVTALRHTTQELFRDAAGGVTIPSVPQADILYDVSCFEVGGFAFDPMLVDRKLYDRAELVHPLGAKVGNMALSPITEKVFGAIELGIREEPGGIVLRNHPLI